MKFLDTTRILGIAGPDSVLEIPHKSSLPVRDIIQGAHLDAFHSLRRPDLGNT